MEDHEIYLKKLKDEIESLPLDDKRRLELIESYNDEIYDLLSFIEKPLSEEYEIADSIILEEYKEFKDYFKKNGYYTFERYIRNIDIIAEVKIKKVKKKVH